MTAPIDRAARARSAVASFALLGLFVACWGPRGPEKYADDRVPSGEQQAADVADAKETARVGVIDETYEKWNRAHLMFRGEVEAAGSDPDRVEGRTKGRGPGWSATDPVRSLDELLAVLEPAKEDPLLVGPIDRWRAACREFDETLRELGNDPTTDPRNPLRSR